MSASPERSQCSSPQISFHKLKITISALAYVSLVLMGCTRTSMPMPATGNQLIQPAPTASGAAPVTAGANLEGSPNFAVVWLPQGDSLPVRDTAGITGRPIAQLSAAETRLERTGDSSQLGSSTWFEVRTPSGINGWVPGWNLTEHVPSTNFCRDQRVQDLLTEFERAIEAEDAAALQALVSPRRGLVVRVDPWNPEIRFPRLELPSVLADPRPMTWGTRYASETEIRGSFTEVVLPSLRQSLAGAEGAVCNRLDVGGGAPDLAWPSEYANLNYYSLLSRPETSVNPYNWHTWAIGVEYVDGQPYVAVLVQYRPQA